MSLFVKCSVDKSNKLTSSRLHCFPNDVIQILTWIGNGELGIIEIEEIES